MMAKLYGPAVGEVAVPPTQSEGAVSEAATCDDVEEPELDEELEEEPPEDPPVAIGAP